LFDEVLSTQGSAEAFTLNGGLGYTMDSAVIIGFAKMGTREDMDHHEHFIALEYTWAPIKTQWVGCLAYAELRYGGRGCKK
jgi:hypothetical protein